MDPPRSGGTFGRVVASASASSAAPADATIEVRDTSWLPVPHARRELRLRDLTAPRAPRAGFLRRTTRGLLGAWRLWLGLATLGGMGGGAYAAYDFAMHAPYFDVAEVVLIGAHEELRRELRALVAIEESAGVNILRLDRAELTDRLARHPRVELATIHKFYPGTLMIEVVERRPCAILGGATMFLVDRLGVAMAQIEATDLGAHPGLPFITGTNDADVELGCVVPTRGLATALRLWEAIHEGDRTLARRVGEIHLGERGAIELVLRDGGTRVVLGAEPTGAQLALLERVVLDPASAGIPALALASIDLRFDGQVILRELPPPPPPKGTKPGKASPGSAAATPAAAAPAKPSPAQAARDSFFGLRHYTIPGRGR